MNGQKMKIKYFGQCGLALVGTMEFGCVCVYERQETDERP